jgi:hypothetical protein
MGKRADGYDDSYPVRLKEHLKTGFSIESFVAVVGEDMETIEGWLKTYPEFKKAYTIGEALARKFYEEITIKAIQGEYRGFSAPALKMVMEGRFGVGAKKEDDKGKAVSVQLFLPDNSRTKSGDNGNKAIGGQVVEARVVEGNGEGKGTDPEC